MLRVFVVFVLAPCLAWASDDAVRTDPLYPLLIPLESYFCVDGQGQRRELGEVICITASCQTWLGRCELATNNTIWRKMQDGCPGASLDMGTPGPISKGPTSRPVL